jgi:carboxymethylenebutenolidase
MLRLKPDEVMQDIQAAVAEVDAGQGVVVIGFCWGGGMAIRAAGSMPLAGAVSYYGTSLDRHTKNRAQCPCLLHFGDSDPLVPHEIRDLVKQRIADARVYAYAAGHAFANEARTNYVADAAALAHQRTLDFLHEIFSGQ